MNDLRAGAMDYRAAVASLTAGVLHATGLDRLEIAERMSRLAGREVSKYMLDAYTSEARDGFNLPLWLVPTLETACNTHDITNWLIAMRGGRPLISPEDFKAVIEGIEHQKAELDRLIRKFKKQVGEK
jgi:transcription termination factor NusB